MNLRRPYILLIAGIALCCVSMTLPDHWSRAGSRPECYHMTTAFGLGMDSSDCATIRSIKDTIDGFGTMMQVCDAKEYHKKRIRLSGYMQSQNVAGWAGLWLRVDGKPRKRNKGSEMLAFDNMGDRPVKGTTEWTRYEIVLDVSEDAHKLAYGALLGGTGQVWFDNMSIEVVSDTVPVTDRLKKKKTPQNLDFDK